MSSVYQRLLWLYPAEHRREFGPEMLAVFEDVCIEIESAGPVSRLLFFIREFSGLLRGAVREHLRGMAVFEIGYLLSTRRFNMRNGFRFPKSTAILMTIILLGVIVAIRKGEAIAYSLPHVNPQIEPIHSVPPVIFPPTVVLFFAFFYALGIIGWAILFALRRSGVHRLDEISGTK